VAEKSGPIIRSVLFFAIAPGVVAGWLPYVMTRWQIEPPFLGFRTGRWIGVALVVAGFAALVDCFARFALVGRGRISNLCSVISREDQRSSPIAR
jgi:hypothetical protein